MFSDPEHSPLQRAVMFMVLLNAFTTPLMLSAVNVALPDIADDLKLDAVLINWVPMAYLMASAMFVLVFGRLADMFGRKRLFLIGTTAVIVTSLLASLVEHGIALILARFLQGLAAAMLYATQVALLSSVFPPKRRGRIIGLTVSMIYLGLACGPVLGGLVVDMFGWRSSFLLHIPLAVVVLLLGIFKVSGEWCADVRGDFDVGGAVLYSLSVLLLCLGISTLLKSGVIFLVLGVLSTWFFISLEKRRDHPIFDVSLFWTNRVFAFSCYASAIIYTAVFANIVLLSFYLQYLKMFSATFSGLVMMVQPLTMALFSPLTGRLSDKFEPRILASAGMVITACGLLSLAFLDMYSSVTYLLLALVMTGFGFSLFSSPNINAIMTAVGKDSYGSANGSLAVMRMLGQMMSMVLVTLVFSTVIGQVQFTPAIYENLQQAICLCFFIAAGLCIPGAVFSLVRGRIHGYQAAP